MNEVTLCVNFVSVVKIFQKVEIKTSEIGDDLAEIRIILVKSWIWIILGEDKVRIWMILVVCAL